MPPGPGQRYVTLSAVIAASIGLCAPALAQPCIPHIEEQARRAPRGSERDRLVATLLQHPALLKRLGEPLEGTPYELRSVTYEKVLWRLDADRGAEIPYDAQLWLRLAPRR